MFESVKSNRISEYIISQIRNAVFEGKLKPGDRLPPEHQLMETFGVSKATLREALRGLELLGFLQVRKGVEGGAIITEVDIKPALGCLTNYLHFKNPSISDLTQVRILLESYGAEKAAAAISPEEIGRLEELNGACAQALESGNQDEIRKNEIEFHRIIAGVTPNPILAVLVDIVENLLDGTKEILQPDKTFSEKVLAAHKRITEALLQKNPDQTRDEMLKHIREVERDLIMLQEERRKSSDSF
jgi:GntR family transcriptional regulator, transcriptional repressor for pyruvate dehydrogenase complex